MKNLLIAMTLMLSLTGLSQFSRDINGVDQTMQYLLKEEHRANPDSLTYYKWETGTYVDVFGDETKNYYNHVFCLGTFSNSAATNQELIVEVWEESWEVIYIGLYQYWSTLGICKNENVARGLGGYGKINYKLRSGIKGSIDCYAPKEGGLVFHGKNYKKIKKLLNENPGKTISFAVSHFEGWGDLWRFNVICPL